jgi:hypothetical protein
MKKIDLETVEILKIEKSQPEAIAKDVAFLKENIIN